MSGIKQPLQDVMTRLSAIAVTNKDGKAFSQVIRVWNNQVAYIKEGKYSGTPLPAFFVEIINNPVYEIIGQQFRSCDISFRIHIVDELYDDQSGNMEQNLPIFDTRDKVVAYLTAFKPTACGPLESMGEGMDYEHDNVYHYIIDFVCNFTDSIGSRYDPNHPDKYVEGNISNLQIDKTVQLGPGQLVTTKFEIPQ